MPRMFLCGILISSRARTPVSNATAMFGDTPSAAPNTMPAKAEWDSVSPK